QGVYLAIAARPPRNPAGGTRSDPPPGHARRRREATEAGGVVGPREPRAPGAPPRRLPRAAEAPSFGGPPAARTLPRRGGSRLARVGTPPDERRARSTPRPSRRARQLGAITIARASRADRPSPDVRRDGRYRLAPLLPSPRGPPPLRGTPAGGGS